MKAPPSWLSRTWEWGGLGGMVLAALGGVVLTISTIGFFATLDDAFAVSNDAVAAATATIDVVDNTLDIIDGLIESSRELVDQGEQALQDVATVTASAIVLMREDLPAQIDSMLVAMDGLIETARVVDNVLSALSLVGVDYDPEVPLDEGLKQVESSLAEIPLILEEEADQLFVLASSVVDLSVTVGDFDSTLTRLEVEVGRSRDAVEAYRDAAEAADDVIAEAAIDLTAQRAVAVVAVVAGSVLLAVFCSRLWWVGRSSRSDQ